MSTRPLSWSALSSVPVTSDQRAFSYVYQEISAGAKKRMDRISDPAESAYGPIFPPA
jgi:hypothetical protein